MYREHPVSWLTLATLPAEQRGPFLDDLDAAAVSTEARANPLLVDFVGESVSDVLERARGWFLPLCTAAQALLEPLCYAPDGFAVEALPRGASPRDGDVSGWRAGPEGANARRARFLAWGASRSLVLRGSSRADLVGAERTLRPLCCRTDSSVALVVTKEMAHGVSPDPRIDGVLARFSRLARAPGAPALPLSPVLPRPGEELVPWLALSDRELLVVPKLGALSPSRRFGTEVLSSLNTRAIEILGTTA
jgi:hypothetical protein